MPDPQTYSLPTFASAMGGIPYAPVAIPQVYSAAPVAGAQAPIEPFTLSRLGGLAQGSLEQAFGNIRYGLPAAVGGLLGGLSPEQAGADQAGLDYWNQKARCALWPRMRRRSPAPWPACWAARLLACVRVRSAASPVPPPAPLAVRHSRRWLRMRPVRCRRLAGSARARPCAARRSHPRRRQP